MAKLISKTYGDALFELAVEENKVDVLLDEIVKDVVSSSLCSIFLHCSSFRGVAVVTFATPIPLYF